MTVVSTLNGVFELRQPNFLTVVFASKEQELIFILKPDIL